MSDHRDRPRPARICTRAAHTARCKVRIGTPVAAIRVPNLCRSSSPKQRELALVNAAFASGRASEDKISAVTSRPVPRPVPN